MRQKVTNLILFYIHNYLRVVRIEQLKLIPTALGKNAEKYDAQNKTKGQYPTLMQTILQSFSIALMFASVHVVAAIQATFP